MTHVFGLDTPRATHDVDFAIALDHWERFNALKAALVATGSFTPAADRIHLLHYKPTEYGNAFPLDARHRLCRSLGISTGRGGR